jgi:RNA polymerase sigma factor (sigma-70 family)
MQRVLLHTQTDERLARLSAAGRAGAFTVLVERHRRSLHRVALAVVSVTEAEDVVQQSLLQAWAALQRGAEIQHVRGWLHQIVRHVAVRHRALPVPFEKLDDAARLAVSITPDPDTRLRMRETLAAVAALPDGQRAALLRCAIHGESQAAVAADLQTTETALRQLLYRARATLRAAATALVPFPAADWAATAATAGTGAGATVIGGAKVVAAVAVLAGVGSPTAVPHQTPVVTGGRTAAQRPARTLTAAAPATAGDPTPTGAARSTSRPADQAGRFESVAGGRAPAAPRDAAAPQTTRTSAPSGDAAGSQLGRAASGATSPTSIRPPTASGAIRLQSQPSASPQPNVDRPPTRAA